METNWTRKTPSLDYWTWTATLTSSWKGRDIWAEKGLHLAHDLDKQHGFGSQNVLDCVTRTSKKAKAFDKDAVGLVTSSNDSV